ncbi:RHS repeat-associated core domain-containing protein [Cognatilysobacter bugurensis]|uniref:Type IV secretion protein Rhs n=1 Tax=Cognatilysobacter bugurensis TaxID=543356 RepID=A0A918STC7_9GAMM|nr:RHS repeat-associated core domain-containing protein [Lysobacter bugurensis]GHA70168.1 hypothetical protein GCM10007067_02800 [Lysobacter bugurensis]
MTLAAKHFDPQLGIDIHQYLAPPAPLPTPHIGMVLDPFDYLPIIGGTVHVSGVKRATAGTGGLCIHIPLGAWVPPMKAPMGPQFEDELFMGSRTVLADGEPFSRLGMPVLDCNLVGMIPPVRPKSPPKPKMSLTLPTAINVAIPTTVNVGGPPTISMTAMAFKGAFWLLKKSGVARRAADAFANMRRRACKNMNPGLLKCKVLRAEPVDIRDGSVVVTHEDFSIPGRLPLAWTRHYRSSETYAGASGHGWQTPADIRLVIEPDGAVLFVDVQSTAVFPHLPAGEGTEHAVLEFVDGARLMREADACGVRYVVRTKDGLRYVFVPPSNGPSSMPIERIEDLCGNHWQFERVDGHLVRIVESGIIDEETGQPLQGRFLEIDSRQGRVERIALHDPGTGLNYPLVRYRYDAAGDLIAAHDALDAPRTFEYREHRMVRHTDRLGLSFHYAFDDQWRVIRSWGDGGLYRYTFEYDALLRETQVTDSLGHTSLVKFDENGLPLCEIDPLDGVAVFEYDDVGRTTAVVDPMGLRTAFDYDERGNLLKLTRADGSVLETSYDAGDRPVDVIDPGGAIWSQRWDDRGLLLEQSTPLGAISRFGYNAYGQLRTHADPLGAVTRLQFDRHGQLQQVVDPLAVTSHYQHDALGSLQAQTGPAGQVTRYRHDGKGRLLEMIQPDGGRIHCEYDAEDQLLRHRDEAGHVTRLEYVGIGQIARRLQADGHSVCYEYDTEEQLTAVINQRGERYELRRDALGRIIEEVDYWGQARLYRYDACGRLLATEDALGHTVSYTTDKLGRVLGKALPDPDRTGHLVQETFRYDDGGRLVELRNPHRHVTCRFDPEGRLVEEVQDGFRITSRFDALGRRVARETSAGNRVLHTFDARGQVGTVRINNDVPIVIERDLLGRAVNEKLGEHLQRRLHYDGRGLMTVQSVLRDELPLFETSYGYDGSGNLTERRDSEHGSDCYTHDPLGRVMSHADPTGRIAHFLNDAAGDRLQTRVRPARMKRVSGGDAMPDLWTREGVHEGVRYVFDRTGTLVLRSTDQTCAGLADRSEELHLRWDASQRLVESRKGTEITRYGYDAVGRRVFKRNATHTTWFFWDGDTLAAEVVQDDASRAPCAATGSNVLELTEFQEKKRRTAALHARAREYVYHPGTFVPLALIERQPIDSALHVRPRSACEVTARSDVDNTSEPSAPAARALSRNRFRPDPGDPTGVLLASLSEDPGWAVLGHTAGLSGAMRSRGLGSLSLGGAPADRPGAGALGRTALLGGIVREPAPARPARPSETDQSRVRKRPADPARIPPEDSGAAEVYYYHVDPNGCPTRLTDPQGNVVWSASYTAWGATTRQSGSIQNHLRLQGQYLDMETGLHYNRFRYYDVRTGAYISQDPVGIAAGPNIYEYGPNTGMFVDPLGLSRYRRVTASDGRTVYQRDDLFDPQRKSAWKDPVTGQWKRGSNLDRMGDGLAPIGTDGKSVQLHHLTQTEINTFTGQRGSLVEILTDTHQNHSRILHYPFPRDPNRPKQTLPRYPSFRKNADGTASALDKQFNDFRTAYWKRRAADLLSGCRS